jgi:hypothetical protein
MRFPVIAACLSTLLSFCGPASAECYHKGTKWGDTEAAKKVAIEACEKMSHIMFKPEEHLTICLDTGHGVEWDFTIQNHIKKVTLAPWKGDCVDAFHDNIEGCQFGGFYVADIWTYL